MLDRYIRRKGIIFNRIVEKGDTDQVTKLQRKQISHGKSGGVRSRRLDSPRRIQECEESLRVCDGAG